MRLIDELTQRLACESSVFRAQLLREDVARLQRLDALARSTPDAHAYRNAARRLGWTAQDARTHELGEPLDRLIDAVRDGARGDDADARIRAAWIVLWDVRLERLVGCLSSPVPKPDT
jgi:hypothetical protein